MKGFYYIIDSLKTELLTIPFVKTVTEGNNVDIDLAKQTIYPLSNIQVTAARPKENIIEFDISFLSVDILNYSKEKTTDIFKGNNDRQDILNNQLIVASRLEASLRHGALCDLNIELISSFDSEIYEGGENILTGWLSTFTLSIANEMSKC